MLTPSDLSRTRDDDGRWVGGSARQWIEELTGAILEHGASGFNTTITDETRAHDLDVARRFAEEVVPAVSTATR